MNEYEIGRDLQELQSRIERLESSETRVRHSGAHKVVVGGVPRHQEPRLWKPEKALQLPPFLSRFLGVPERFANFDLHPESKTWACQPEPLILSVNWNAGGSDEFYRLQNQIFSVIRITEPNSGHISCTLTYFARLIASGRARSHVFPFTGNPNFAGDNTSFVDSSHFKITLIDSAHAFLGSYTSGRGYSISCQDNYDFIQSWDFDAGIYDLVAGATWEITGQTMDRC